MRGFYGNYNYTSAQISSFVNHSGTTELSTRRRYWLDCLILAAMVLTFLLPWLVSPAQGVVMAPDGALVAQVGPDLFRTDRITAQQLNGRLIIEAVTNYHPWPDYNVADVKIGLGPETLAVKLSGPRRGDIVLNPTWNTSALFAQADIPHGRQITGAYIPVQACGGQTIGQADINLTDTGWRLSVPLDALPGTGRQNIRITWGTAFCGNSLAETTGVVILPGEALTWGGPVASQPYCADHPSQGPGTTLANYGNFPASGLPWLPFGGDGYCNDVVDPSPPCPPDPPAPPVPLPGSCLLLLAGLIRMILT